jgi:hypothetical protein
VEARGEVLGILGAARPLRRLEYRAAKNSAAHGCERMVLASAQ